MARCVSGASRSRSSILMIAALTLFGLAAVARGQERPTSTLKGLAELDAAPKGPKAEQKESKELIVVARELLKAAQTRKARKLRMSLTECIVIALDNSLDIKIQRISPLEAAEDVITARAAFDPSIVSGTTSNDGLLRYSTSRQESLMPGVSPTTTQGAGGNLGVQQPTYTGGAVTLGYDLSYVDTADNAAGYKWNPYWDSKVFLNLTHPLLQGAGLEYNLAGIRVAVNNKTISHEEFRAQLMQIIFSVEQAYWNLVRANEDLRVSIKSLEVAIDNRHSSYLQFKAGTQPELEVTTADSGVATRLSTVIESEADVRDREDALKAAVNLPEDWYLTDLAVVPTDQPREDVAGDSADLGLAESIQVALRARPEMRQAELGIRNAGIGIKTARNELMPDLNTNVGLSWSGLKNTPDRAAGSMGTMRHYEYGAGLTFSYPIGNRSKRAGFRKARLARRRARLQLDQLRQNIIVAVRAARRRITTDRKRVLASQEARKLQKKRLEAEQRKKEVGRATSLDVLNVEEDYVDAQRDHVNALIDYQISLVSYERAIGTLLESRKIEVGKAMEPTETGAGTGR